jgi:hypothetical protein
VITNENTKENSTHSCLYMWDQWECVHNIIYYELK